MSKSLEYIKGKITDLEDDLQHLQWSTKIKLKEYFIKDELEKLYSLEKELKALEIIKSKSVDVNYLLDCIEDTQFPLKYYNDKNVARALTKEEFDLLNEVFGKCTTLEK